MLDLIVGIAVALGAFAGQTDTPVFRGEVYVVPVEFSLSRRSAFGLIRRPYKDLTLEDVTVVLDKKAYPPVNLTQDDQKPGHYLLSFTPPDEYRDGQSHLIEVTLKAKGWRSPMTMPRTVVFPNQAMPVAAPRPDDPK